MSRSTPATHNARFADLVGLMALLRSPSGCPWDRQQDHRSLRPCLLEETYEVLEAIDHDEAEALRQELGDLLLQVVFHAQLAAEAGRFDIGDVVTAIHDKLIARHPHVFGDASAETPEAVLHQWDSLKRKEREAPASDLFTEVPSALPALARAQVVLRRASRAGLIRPPSEARDTAAAALATLAESPDARAVGELLLAAVELAQEAEVDAEQALRERLDRFITEVRSRAPDANIAVESCESE